MADGFEKKADIRREVADMAKVGILACEWGTLLDESGKRWKEFLDILKERAPDDPRLAAL